MTRFLLHHFVAVVAVVAVAAYAAVYAWHLAGAPVRADGYSYFVYLPSWVLHGDTSLESVARDCCSGTFPDFTAIIRWPGTNRFVNAHPIGVAVLVLPFFLAAIALSWWSNLPLDGFSLYFQHAAGLAGVFYFVAGLAVLRSLLRRHFTDGIALATLAAITFGTNLFHYGVYESGYSHAYSFFLITSLAAVTERWWESASWPRSVLLGLLVGLVFLTRHPNLLFALMIALYSVESWSDLRMNARKLWLRRARVGAVMLTASCIVLPQLAIYHAATGHWIVSSYGELGFDFGRPRITEVLFGVTKGLFFWSPILLLAIAGVAVHAGSWRRFRMAVVVIFLLHTYILASWWDWQFGASFGHRGFTDMLGLLALPLAGFFAWIRPSRARIPVAALAAAAVMLCTFQMMQYWGHVLPISDTTWAQYRDAFLKLP